MLLILHNCLKAKPDRPEIIVQKNYDNLPTIECYPGALNQVFMNVITNAVDALDEYSMQGDRAQITIETRCEKDKVIIAIADNGTGIPRETLEKLYDPFFTTKPVGQGTELGLVISYQIVNEQHGGQLSCTSEIGQRTTFTIELPI